MKRASSVFAVLMLVATIFAELQFVTLYIPTAMATPYPPDTLINKTEVIIEGSEFSGYAGSAVSILDDINGDSIDDAAIGEPAVLSGRGRTMVFNGNPSWGFSATLSLSKNNAYANLIGEATGDRLGTAIQSVGDVNGGGKGDFVITAVDHGEGTKNKVGAAYLVLGENFFSCSTIDTNVATHSKFILVGMDDNERLGGAVGRLGDINGDGFDDFAVGATNSKRCPGTGRGAVYFIFGSTSLPNKIDTGNITTYVCGPSDGYGLGASMAGGGDVNRDGYPELLLGAPFYSGMVSNGGKVHLIYGGPEIKKKISGGPPVTEAESASFVARATNAYLGSYGTMAVRGDFNGDGYADIIVSAPYMMHSGSAVGKVFVIKGNWLPYGKDVDVEGFGSCIVGNNANDNLGMSVAYGGDTAGSGFDDIFIGATGYDLGGLSDRGTIYSIRGRASSIGANVSVNSVMTENIIGRRQGEFLPSFLSGSGDLNGDGLMDVLAGSMNYQPMCMTSGAAFVIMPRTVATTFGFNSLIVFRNRDREAFTNVPVGQEVLIQVKANTQVGIIETVRIKVSDSSGTRSIMLTALETGVSTGTFETRLRLGFTTDRVAKTFRATPGWNNLTVMCPDSMPPPPISTTLALNPDLHLSLTRPVLSTERTKSHTGSVVAFVGDIAGSYRDAIAVREVDMGSSRDEVVIASNSALRWPITPMELLANESFKLVGRDGTYLGVSISGMDDVNGDGLDDYLIGEVSKTDPSNNRVYLMPGGKTNWGNKVMIENFAPIFFKPAAGYAGIGAEVAMVGDMDGDGLGDIALGAPDTTVNGTDMAGSVHIFRGRTTWPSSISTSDAEVSILGTLSKGHLGASLAGSGDVNGDGLCDLVMGAPGENTGLGTTYILLGRRHGFDREATEVAWPSQMTTVNASFKISGTGAGGSLSTLFGTDTSVVGDLNGDDMDELALSAGLTASDGTSDGRVYLFTGRTEWTNLTDLNAETYFKSENTGDRASMVSRAGDMDGDGLDDMLIGAPKADGGWFDGGRAYILKGRNDVKAMPSLQNADLKVWSEGKEDLAGVSIDGGGDLNGDGYDNVIIGAPDYSGLGEKAGKAYVMSMGYGDMPANPSYMKVFKDKALTNPVAQYVDMGDELWVQVKAMDVNPNGRDILRAEAIGSIVDPHGITFNLRETTATSGDYVANFKVRDITNKGHAWLGAVPTDNLKVRLVDYPSMQFNMSVDTHPEVVVSPDPTVAIEDAPFELIIGYKGTYKPKVVVTGLPVWLKESGVQANTYIGIPNNTHIGTFTFNVTITDPFPFTKSASRDVLLTVRNVPPVILNPPPEEAIEGVPYYVDLDSSDDGQGIITWSLTDPNSFLHINGTTGVLNGTPDDIDVGRYIVQVRVDDGNPAGTITTEFNLTVFGTNDPPVITSVPIMTAFAGMEYQYDVNATDNDTAVNMLKYFLEGPPFGMTINPSTGLITWMPSTNDIGDRTIKVRVSDGTDNATQTYTLIVKLLTKPPRSVLLAPADGETLPVLNPVLRWNGTDPDGQPVNYDVYMSKNRVDVELKIAGARMTSGIIETYFQVATLLEAGATYYWTAIPRDQADGEGICDSGIWKFVVATDAVVNSPPIISSIPPDMGAVGALYEYIIGAYDPDGANLTYNLTKGPDNMVLEGSVIHWTPRESDKPSVSVAIKVSDGLLSTFQEWEIIVQNGTPNHQPVIDFIMDQTAEVGKSFEYKVTATDQDAVDQDKLEFSLVKKPAGMTIDLKTGVITWAPGEDAADKTFEVMVRVWDGKDKAETSFQITVKRAPGGTTGGVANDDLLGILLVLLIVLVICGVIGYMVVSKKKRREQEESLAKEMDKHVKAKPVRETRPPAPAPSQEPEPEMYTAEATAVAPEPTGYAYPEETAAVTEAAPPIREEPAPAEPLQDKTKDVLVGWDMEAASASGMTPAAAEATEEAELYSSEGYTLDKDAPVPGSMATKAGTAPAVEAPVVAATVEVAAPVGAAAAVAGTAGAGAVAIGAGDQEVEHFSIDEIFVIYKDGRLISHTTTQESEIDKDVVSSMLVAVQTFVKDSFGSCPIGTAPGDESGSLESFTFSGRQIVMECGNYVILAVAMSGTEPPQLRDLMRRTVQKMEGMYAGVIEEWDGSTEMFRDIVVFTAPIFKLGSTLRVKQKTEDVKVLSALEFFEGYVRLKLAVRNKTKAVITDATLTLKYNRDALKFHHIEPEYPLEGRSVELGNIKPNEKKTVAIYLDPQICMESYIDCTLTYYDFEGKMHHVDMKRRPIDIVCPIFYTPRTVNVAMLRRLIGELRFKDSKFYKIPKTLTPQQAFERAKNAIEKHDVKFVREYMEDEVAGQYVGEAWYYGKTQTTEEELVIRTTITQKDRTLEIFVASSNLASMTGLLSELGQNINQRTAGVVYKEEDLLMKPTTGAQVKEESGERPLLLDKYAAKEMDVGTEVEGAGPPEPKGKEKGKVVKAPTAQPAVPPTTAPPKKDDKGGKKVAIDDLEALLKDL